MREVERCCGNGWNGEVDLYSIGRTPTPVSLLNCSLIRLQNALLSPRPSNGHEVLEVLMFHGNYC